MRARGRRPGEPGGPLPAGAAQLLDVRAAGHQALDRRGDLRGRVWVEGEGGVAGDLAQ